MAYGRQAESKAWQKKVLLILSDNFYIHTRKKKVYEREFFLVICKVNRYSDS